MTKTEGRNPKLSMKRILARLFRRPVFTANQVPFRPYNTVTLTQQQVRDALAGQGKTMPVAAMVQLLEAEIGRSVSMMAAGEPGAAPAYRLMREVYDGVTALLDADRSGLAGK